MKKLFPMATNTVFWSILFCLFAICTSCATMGPRGGMASPSLEKQEARCPELEELAALSLEKMESGFDRICHARKCLERCLRLEKEGDLTREERRELRELVLRFERMEAEGEILLAHQACQDTVKRKDENGYEALREDLRIFVEVMERHSRRPELWETRELRQMGCNLAILKTDLANLEKSYGAYREECRKHLEKLRIEFEYRECTNYIESARKLYLRQKRKWFNWGWLGHWRDDATALYQGMDFCQRVEEATYASNALKNQASRQSMEIQERFSQKEVQYYNKRHRNEVKPVAALPGYPKDTTEQYAKEKAWRWFQEEQGRKYLSREKGELVFQPWKKGGDRR